MKQTNTRPTQQSDMYETQTANVMPTANVTQVTPIKRFTQSNPYLFKKFVHTNKDRLLNPGMLVKIISDVINTLKSHDKNVNTRPWYKLWLEWGQKRIDKPTIHNNSKLRQRKGNFDANK